jgi:hypothetical protein
MEAAFPGWTFSAIHRIAAAARNEMAATTPWMGAYLKRPAFVPVVSGWFQRNQSRLIQEARLLSGFFLKKSHIEDFQQGHAYSGSALVHPLQS